MKMMIPRLLLCGVLAYVGQGSQLTDENGNAIDEPEPPMIQKGQIAYVQEAVVVQKLKSGVFIRDRNESMIGKSWRNAPLAFLRIANGGGMGKGTQLPPMYVKCIGSYRHGNFLTGHREFSAFVPASQEEITQYKNKLEEEKKKIEEQERQAMRRRMIEKEQQRFEDEQRRIKEQAERERVRREAQKIKEENDRRIEAERAKAEMEAIKQRQEAERKAEEERKRRYPIEQKERAAYAEMKLSKISFDARLYFKMQKDLEKYVYSLEVTEKLWNDLVNLQQKKDWLGMLNAIGGTRSSDYPDTKNIAALLDQLCKEQFHLAILFTHDNLRIEARYGLTENEYKMHYEDEVSKGLIVTFCMADTDIQKNMCILYHPYAKGYDVKGHGKRFGGYVDGWGYFGRLASEKREKLREDLRLGRIAQAESENVLQQIQKEFEANVTTWLDTAIIDNAERLRPIQGRSKVISKDVSSGGRQSQSTRTQVKSSKPTICPDCNGSRYISSGKCQDCGGVGWYQTEVKRGIGGRLMGGRKSQCPKCNGIGEVKTMCKRCRGSGKIKP